MNLNPQYWIERLEAVAARHGFDEGYNLSYQPFAWIPECTHAFLSLNPGAKAELLPQP